MIRRALLLHETDEALRRLERQAAANPSDLHLKRKLVVARGRAGHLSPEQTSLHHAGLDLAQAKHEEGRAWQQHWGVYSEKMHLSPFKRGYKYPKHGAWEKKHEASEHQHKLSMKKVGKMRTEFVRQAREEHAAGRNVMHAFYRPPERASHLHQADMGRLVRKLTGSHHPWSWHGGNRGYAAWDTKEAADLHAEGLRHHYNHKVTQSVDDGGQHRVEYEAR